MMITVSNPGPMAQEFYTLPLGHQFLWIALIIRYENIGSNQLLRSKLRTCQNGKLLGGSLLVFSEHFLCHILTFILDSKESVVEDYTNIFMTQSSL